MTKSKLASWIIAAVVLTGGSMAFAETAPEGPAVIEGGSGGDGTGTTTTEGDGTGTTTETDGTTEDGTTEEEEEGATEEEKAAHPDNHGALVSAAAHDHQYDEACGNHGKVVSSVARTGELPECATAGAGEGGTVEGGEETVTASSHKGDKSEKKAAKGKSSKASKSSGKSSKSTGKGKK